MSIDLGQRRTRTSETRDGVPLRRGWTTGACATAATKAALTALLTGDFPDPVEIALPKGERPAFPLARTELTETSAFAAIVKDAGDDPDVTHLAEVGARVRLRSPGTGLVFRAGPGVGTVTRPGLPIPPGEPAINPVPRALMRAEVEALCAAHALAPDIEIAIEVRDGEKLAEKTWNGRLGILGGLSILGTTGVVHPFSCSAWIHSIHRGIDVARASGLAHVVGATGSASEGAARRLYPELPDIAYLDMGDFAGGVLKYLRRHPVPRLTLVGGFAKFTKLAQGSLDLHSGRSQVDLGFLLDLLGEAGRGLETAALGANTAKEVLDLASARGLDISAPVAIRALATAREALGDAPCEAEVLVTDRSGRVIARAGDLSIRALILGGTAEATILSKVFHVEHRPQRWVLSLAGRTLAPDLPDGIETRIGGFGGASGLADWIRAEAITHLVDATHPFAAGISRNAAEAAARTGVKRLALHRPGWEARPSDLWQRVACLKAARDALPEGARPFLALGRQHIAPFRHRPDLRPVLRMVDQPGDLPFPTDLVLGKPGDEDGEIALFRRLGVTHVVCRDAGGNASYAKIGAARALGLPVILIDRPAPPPPPLAASVAE